MEENLEQNKEVSDNTNKSNSEEIKEPKSEKEINMHENNDNSQNNSASKVDIKNEQKILNLTKNIDVVYNFAAIAFHNNPFLVDVHYLARFAFVFIANQGF